MKMKIEFIEKNVYGRSLFYPGCEISRLICSVAKRKCLRDDDILLIENMGWKVLKNEG